MVCGEDMQKCFSSALIAGEGTCSHRPACAIQIQNPGRKHGETPKTGESKVTALSHPSYAILTLPSEELGR